MNRSRPPPVVLSIEGPIARADIPLLCACLGPALAACEGDRVICDVGEAHPDLVLVEALARLQLTAGRLGGGLLLRRASRDLLGLVAFLGFADVLPAELPLELEGEAEQREQPRGVQEERDSSDPAAGELQDLE